MTEKALNTAKSTARNVPRHTPEGAAISELVLTIFRANGRLLKAGDALLSDLNIAATRWQVFGAIVQTPKTVAQIARQYELSRQGVLFIVQALVKDELVELVRNPDHKRAKLVTPTKRGRKLYDEIDRRQHRWSNEIGTAFRLDKIRTATECLRLLAEVVAGNGGDADE